MITSNNNNCKIYTKSNQITPLNTTSLAYDYNPETDCNIITVTKKPPMFKTVPSNYTSQGKRKACPTDPIRSQEDIIKVKEYLLCNGRTPQLRLRNYALFILGTSVGIRTCDLLRLQIQDILNPDGSIVDEIKVFESKTHKRNYPFLNAESKQALADYLDSLPSYQYSDVLFKKFGSGNEPFTSQNVRKLMLKIKDALKLPYNMGAYTMRKTFAYWTIKLHPDNLDTMIALQEMLNHDSMNTTLHYSGIAKDNIKHMYDDIGKVFDPTFKDETTTKNNDIINQIYKLISTQLDGEDE